MDLASAQTAFVQLLGQIRPDSKLQFLQWACTEYSPGAAQPQSNAIMEEQEEDESHGLVPFRLQAIRETGKIQRSNGGGPGHRLDLLDKLALDIRSSIPPNGLAPNEVQIYQSEGPNSDLSIATTLHVDSFLYPTEDDIDGLCSQLQISRNYCLNCGSWKTAPLNFISHSMSREQLKFIFTELLPDLTGKTVLDVGSRLGAVLYGGYFYSRASRLVGVEISSYFYDVQLQLVAKYGLADRTSIVCADICSQAALLCEADVIILNNVFEVFLPRDQQASIWEFLFTTIRKPGTVLVTVPSLQESLQYLPLQAPLLLEQWVREVPTGASQADEELNNIHLYSVL